MNINDAYSIVAPLNYSDDPDHDVEVHHREQEMAKAAREVRYKELLADPECVLEAFQEITHSDEFDVALKAYMRGDMMSAVHQMRKLVDEYLLPQSEE